MAFTIKELREMLHIKGCRACFNPHDFSSIPRDIHKSLQRPRKRLTELLFKAALDPPTDKQLNLWGENPSKSWHLKLLRSPLEIHSDQENKVCGLTLAINQLKGNKFDEQQSIEVSLSKQKEHNYFKNKSGRQ